MQGRRDGGRKGKHKRKSRMQPYIIQDKVHLAWSSFHMDKQYTIGCMYIFETRWFFFLVERVHMFCRCINVEIPMNRSCVLVCLLRCSALFLVEEWCTIFLPDRSIELIYCCQIIIILIVKIRWRRLRRGPGHSLGMICGRHSLGMICGLSVIITDAKMVLLHAIPGYKKSSHPLYTLQTCTS